MDNRRSDSIAQVVKRYSPLLWRTFSALLSATLGIFLTRQYLPDLVVSALRLERVIAALVFGAFGYFLIPICTEFLRNWSVSLALRVASEVVGQMRHLRAKRTEKAKRDWDRPLVLDTSAIIDGRLADIVDTGFITGTFLVPQFILAELHQIADAQEMLKRARGRRGLDILAQLKKSKQVKLVIVRDEIPGSSADHKLLILAKQVHGKVVTTDFNLNKVAQVEGVAVLNVNALANAVKTVLLPGESLMIRVIQEGKSSGQGVGYLPDGTMVVVEEGATFIGKKAKVVVARVLQTVAGRMIFVQPDKQ